MFIQLLVSVENEGAFGLLYCITFKLMDQQWLAMHAFHTWTSMYACLSSWKLLISFISYYANLRLNYLLFQYLPISYDVHTSSAGKRDAAQKHITPWRHAFLQSSSSLVHAVTGSNQRCILRLEEGFLVLFIFSILFSCILQNQPKIFW